MVLGVAGAVEIMHRKVSADYRRKPAPTFDIKQEYIQTEAE